MPETTPIPQEAKDFKFQPNSETEGEEKFFKKDDEEELDSFLGEAFNEDNKKGKTEGGKLLSDGKDIESKTTKPAKPEENN